MQAIDPVYVLEPVAMIGLSVGTVLYWRWKKGFSRYVLAYSLLAYGGAIAAKVVFQYVTAPAILSTSQGSLWLLGLYFGLQTVFLEVGGAFLVARYAVSTGKLRKNDGVGYGLGLAFWENGILIGALSLLSTLYYFFALSQGGPAAENLYSVLSSSHPELFYAPIEALQMVGWGLLERISSLLVHLCWGYLCLKSATSQMKRYLCLALPMGLIDFIVPFVRIMTLPLFEIVVFMFAAFCVLATVYATESYRKRSRN